MEYTIENRGQYICITLQGRFDIKVMQPGLPVLLKVLKEVHISKILLDCREMIGPFSRIDRYYVNVWLAGMNVEYESKDNKPLRIAAILDKTLVDPERFGETVARNHGLTTHIVTSAEEAFQWLDVAPSDECVRLLQGPGSPVVR
jgi:hypothetical protein